MMITEQRLQSPQQGSGFARQASPRAMVAIAALVFAGLVLAFWVSWPAAVALGLVVCVVVTVRVGQRMHAAAQAVPIAHGLEDHDDELWQEFRRLRVRLGEDWAGFGAAAVLVIRAQSASASLLRRELDVSTGQAQYLIQLLEREGFVGPARGTQPRLVRVERDRAPLLEELLHA